MQNVTKIKMVLHVNHHSVGCSKFGSLRTTVRTATGNSGRKIGRFSECDSPCDWVSGNKTYICFEEAQTVVGYE